jgi:hypothetical protein
VADQLLTEATGEESVADRLSAVMGVPEVEVWEPGLVTETVLVMLQVKEVDPLNGPPFPEVTESVAVSVTEQLQAVVGVPVTAPVVALIESPVGSPVAAQLAMADPPESLAEGV